MFVVRPVELTDIDALEKLAAATMPGVHTLPKTREKIAASVERSIASFAAHVDIPSEESYLFVLEQPRARSSALPPSSPRPVPTAPTSRSVTT
jgi:arginine N-succinyltransferase